METVGIGEVLMSGKVHSDATHAAVESGWIKELHQNWCVALQHLPVSFLPRMAVSALIAFVSGIGVVMCF